ncbi:PMCA-type calcium-translocating P-type ATPase [Phlyctochytrium arcticum]|nr:PMCA-type calcium-translocating P-type ATPase [Phlyctochytrium arcticum]
MPSPSHKKTAYSRLPSDDSSSSSSNNKLLDRLSDVFADPNSNQDVVDKELGGVSDLLKAFHVDPEKGIRPEEQEQRQKTYGENVLPDPPTKTFLKLVWEAYHDKTLILLSFAAALSLGIGLWEDYLSGMHDPDEPKVGWVDGAGILVAVLVVVLTNSLNDYQKERQFRKLTASQPKPKHMVLRSGHKQMLDGPSLVTGDILLLRSGDILPADCILIQGRDIKVDESAATGEADSIEKKEGGILVSGTRMQEGTGKALVCCVGENSVMGSTMMSIREDSTDQTTPLQEKLHALAERIAKFGIAAAILMFLTLLTKYFITRKMDKSVLLYGGGGKKESDTVQLISDLVAMVLQSVTIVVVAVPEGLPMAVTIALAYATTRMMKDNNLVRVLSACETMGNATTICSDKTGTLTVNDMVVLRKTLEAEKAKQKPKPKPKAKKPSKRSVKDDEDDKDKSEQDRPSNAFTGSRTDVALLLLARSLGYEYKDLRAAAHVVHTYPFSSEKKSEAVLIETDEGTRRMYVKGAAEMLLENCEFIKDQNGSESSLSPQKMTDEHRKKLENLINSYAEKALRVILVAYKDVKSGDEGKHEEEGADLTSLTLLALVGMHDPLRSDVPDAVSQCRRAHVTVRMVTGDNLTTAKAIASQCGIYTRGGVCLEGSAFRELSEDKLREVVPKLQVLARSSPSDKRLLVKTLRDMGEVVAVTGDGTNDAPALHLADVGFSMGSGTEVAKEASDVVILNDAFPSLTRAILWGRTVNDAVRKFLQFQLTVNFAAVILTFTSALVSPTSTAALTAIQLLWVNLIMDTFAALALATDIPNESVLDRKPDRRSAGLVTWDMMKLIAIQSTLQILTCLGVLLFSRDIFDLPPGDRGEKLIRTFTFNVFVFLQVFNLLSCRIRAKYALLGPFQGMIANPFFLGVMGIIILGQLILIEFGGTAFQTTPLPFNMWIASITIGSVSLFAALIIRLIPDCYIPKFERNRTVQNDFTPERMEWDHVIRDVRLQLRVFKALRRGRKDEGGGVRVRRERRDERQDV